MRFWRIIAVLFLLGRVVFAADATNTRGSCSAAARKVLSNAQVEILAFGDINGTGREHCFAVIPTGRKRDQGKPLAIRRGAVLEFDKQAWRSVLNIRNYVKNPDGYVGIEFIDGETIRYSIEIRAERGDGVKQFTIYVHYRDDPESVPIEISWNRKVGRYQEFSPNLVEHAGYQIEIKNPPVRKCCNISK